MTIEDRKEENKNTKRQEKSRTEVVDNFLKTVWGGGFKLTCPRGPPLSPPRSLDHRTFPEAVVSTRCCSSCTLSSSTPACTTHGELHQGLKYSNSHQCGDRRSGSCTVPSSFMFSRDRARLRSIAELRIAGLYCCSTVGEGRGGVLQRR